MDFQNRSNGSVRRLRDRFEQNNQNDHHHYHDDDKVNNNLNCDKDRNSIKLNDVFNKTQEIRSGPQSKPIKLIADKNFTEKLNKTLKNDSKIFNNSNFKLIKNYDNPLISSKNVPDVSQVCKTNEIDICLSSEPNPIPKPPRTFAHDVYLELKFNKKDSKINNKIKTNNNFDENMSSLYSKPNKANKTKNRLRSQSDSQVMDSKKTNEFNSNENIYDDCINTRSIDKTLKSKLMQFSCLKFKRR